MKHDLKELRALCDAATEGGNVLCVQCGSNAEIEVCYTNVSDKWDPFCSHCHQNNEAIGQEVIDHEMKHFGGAYGLPEWSVRPIIAATDPQTVRALIDEIERLRGALELIRGCAGEGDIVAIANNALTDTNVGQPDNDTHVAINKEDLKELSLYESYLSLIPDTRLRCLIEDIVNQYNQTLKGADE